MIPSGVRDTPSAGVTRCPRPRCHNGGDECPRSPLSAARRHRRQQSHGVDAGAIPRHHRDRRREALDPALDRHRGVGEAARQLVQRQRLHAARHGAGARDRRLGAARARHLAEPGALPRRARPAPPRDARRPRRAGRRAAGARRDQDDEQGVALDPARLSAADLVAAVRAGRRAHADGLGAARELRAGRRPRVPVGGSGRERDRPARRPRGAHHRAGGKPAGGRPPVAPVAPGTAGSPGRPVAATIPAVSRA